MRIHPFLGLGVGVGSSAGFSVFLSRHFCFPEPHFPYWYHCFLLMLGTEALR